MPRRRFAWRRAEHRRWPSLALPGVPDQQRGTSKHHPQRGCDGSRSWGEVLSDRGEMPRRRRRSGGRAWARETGHGVEPPSHQGWQRRMRAAVSSCRPRRRGVAGLRANGGRAGGLEAAAAAQPGAQQQAVAAPCRSARASGAGRRQGVFMVAAEAGAPGEQRASSARAAASGAEAAEGRRAVEGARRRTTHSRRASSASLRRQRRGSAASAASGDRRRAWRFWNDRPAAGITCGLWPQESSTGRSTRGLRLLTSRPDRAWRRARRRRRPGAQVVQRECSVRARAPRRTRSKSTERTMRPSTAVDSGARAQRRRRPPASDGARRLRYGARALMTTRMAAARLRTDEEAVRAGAADFGGLVSAS